MRNILLLILITSVISVGQQIKSWQNYTNMQQINDFDIKDEIIWAATDGGIFSFYSSDSSYFTLTKSEGLSSHTNTAISIDSENKVWVGTSEGYVNIYDPSTNEMKTIFDIFETNESNKRINDIEISNDTAFVSTEIGLILFNTTDFSVFDSILKFGEFTSGTPIKNVFLDETIYVNTQSGIAFKKAGFTNLQAPEAWDNLAIPGISSINKLVNFNGELYAATNRGIYNFDGNTWTNKYLNSSEVIDLKAYANELYCIVPSYNDDDDWITSIVYKIVDNVEETVTTLDLKINKIHKDSDNETFLASNIGIFNLLQSSYENYYPLGPATNAMIDLTVDVNGNLWSATGKDVSGKGAMKFDKSNWSIHNSANTSEFLSNSIHKVSASGDAVYFSNWGKGFIRYQDEIFTTFYDSTGMVGIPGSNAFLTINDIVEDQSGNAWILNYWAADRNPLTVMTADGKFYNYTLNTPLFPSVINVKEIVIDQYNTKWFSGDLSGDEETAGLYYFNENNSFEDLADDDWGLVTESSGLRNNDVRAIALDHFGELIIGTSVGVDVISDTRTPSSIRTNQYYAIRQQTINCIAVDPINQKWFGTEQGIFLLSSDGSSLIANYTKNNSTLPSDKINSIAIAIIVSCGNSNDDT